jgi:hypothetical protein
MISAPSCPLRQVIDILSLNPKPTFLYHSLFPPAQQKKTSLKLTQTLQGKSTAKK